MKIYTKSGDKGETTLIGGKKVPKDHIRIEAYGTIDELIAHVGMLRDLSDSADLGLLLLMIQDRLMVCASVLATDCEDCNIKIPQLSESDIEKIENSIDEMESSLPALKSFILPGGNITSSQCHIARTICRRAERQIIRLSSELFVPDTVLKYVNRLSDYLFVLGRKLLHDQNKDDTLWTPKL
jgi:cob(I)alamin adenosyltransferase